MKTINKITKKLALITGIVMGALILTTTLANAESGKETDKDKAAQAEVAKLEAEVLQQLEEDENFLAEFSAWSVPTIKIFDGNDELVYEAAVADIDTIEDKKLLSLIHRSDFLMHYENTSYYKLNN